MYYVGIDLGATNVRAVVTDASGTRIGSHRRATPRGPRGTDVTEAVLETIRRASDAAGIEPTEISAAGIGSIGPLDLAEGTVLNPANLPPTIGCIPLTGPIGNLIDSDQVYLHNDANAGVIGQRYHDERNPDDMVYLTISSGIGAGACVDGEVLDGWDGNAGEVGHMMLDSRRQRTCGCGKNGHWEAYCSGKNIPKYARDLHDRNPVDTALPLADPDLSAGDIFAHADEDDFADHVVDRIAHWNTMGVTNIVHAYAPIVLYVGGAVALNNEDLVLDPIRERLDEMVFTNVPEIQVTTLGEDVVVKGAIASALTNGTGDRSVANSRTDITL